MFTWRTTILLGFLQKSEIGGVRLPERPTSVPRIGECKRSNVARLSREPRKDKGVIWVKNQTCRQHVDSTGLVQPCNSDAVRMMLMSVSELLSFEKSDAT